MRKILFWIHLVVGVTVGIVVLIMATTGVILAFRPQILALVEHGVRNVTPQGNPLRLEIILEKANHARMKDRPQSITVNSDPAASWVIGFGKTGAVYVNPYTGAFLGNESATHDFLEKVEVWHRWLGAEGRLKPLGQDIKGVCTIAFFFLIVTGFYLWWPSTWNWSTLKQVTTFNPNVRGKARDWNWHNVIGFWCAPFLIIICLTGIIMCYDWADHLLFKMTGNEPPTKTSMEKSVHSGPIVKKAAVSLDVLLTRAQKQAPQWTSMILRLPQSSGGPMTIFIEEAGASPKQSRSQLILDSSTGEIVKWEPSREQNLGRKLRTWVRYLHTGEALGIGGQLIAALASAGAIMLVWTGLSMAWQRFCGWKQKKLKVG